MHRRDFLKASGATALLAGASTRLASAHIPGHNSDKYDFGTGPVVSDRLYQGPFPTDLYPSWNVVMATTPSGVELTGWKSLRAKPAWASA